MARSFLAASSQYILVNSAPSINLGSGDFTVMAWVRFPTIPPNSSIILGKRAGGFDGDQGWEVKFDNASNGDIRFDVQTDITGRQRVEVDIPTLVNGNWHLLGVDHTEGAPATIRIIYDGSVVASNSVATPGTVDTATPLVIGAAYDTPSLTNYLTGQVGPVYICRHLLTLAEHQALAKGYSFGFIRPRPCFWMPLISRAPANEPDITGGLLGGLGNAPGIVDNPRIIPTFGARVGQDLWYEYSAATFHGQSNLTAAIGLLIAGTKATIAAQSNMTATLSAIASIKPAAAIAGQSNIIAQANITASVRARIVAQSGISAKASATVPVSTGISAQSAMAALMSPAVGVVAQIDGQSAISATGDRIRTLSTAVAGQSALSSAATIKAGASAQVDGQSGLTAFLSGTAPVATVVSAQSNVSAQVSALTPAAATFGGQSALTVKMTRAQGAVATIAAQSALVVDARTYAPLAAVIAAQSGLTVSVSADVPVAATIAGQSALAVLPSFPGERKTITVGGYIRWLEKAGGQPI